MPTDAPLFPGTYAFFNLGCPKNLVDAEKTAARLEEAGWRPAAAPDRAELLVVTTCAFIARAVEESVEEILRVAAAKRPGQRLAVLGCLVSREKRSLAPLLPEVDVLLDVARMETLPQALARKGIVPGAAEPAAPRRRARAARAARGSSGPCLIGGRRLFTPPHLAYLKIGEGCSNRCRYCLIPSIRGGLASRPRAEILAEAASLAAAGVRELTVVAQDTTAWGFDRGRKESLYDLLESLADAARFDWIRLMYLHPAHVDAARLVPLIRGGAILPYLDVPVQHAADRILERMGRPYTRRDLETLFERLRASVDDLVLRTTVMTGFPGETEEDFRRLMDFLEEVSFDHVGVFAYSRERGTKAAGLRGAVPPAVAEERREELLDLQMDISQERLRARLGTELPILVDAPLAAEERPRRDVRWVGRFYGQAYDVDGVTFLAGNPGGPGRFVRARVTEAEAYDLVAEPAPR